MELSGRPARRVKRFRTTGKVPAAFIGPGARCTAELRDISTNGCLLVVPNAQVTVGTFARLGIQVGHETLRAGAVAKRVVPGLGVGFEFSQMYPNDRDLLNRLIMLVSTGRPV
jgi:PilZ domain